jgi:hypothetical protein
MIKSSKGLSISAEFLPYDVTPAGTPTTTTLGARSPVWQPPFQMKGGRLFWIPICTTSLAKFILYTQPSNRFYL